MRSHTITVGLLAAFLAPSPVAAAPGSSSVDFVRALVARQSTEPVEGDDQPVEGDAQSSEASELTYPYNGQYAGDPEADDSCGYRLAEGDDDAPGYSDCRAAAKVWEDFPWFNSYDGRWDKFSGTCITVWHPFPDSPLEVTGEDIRDGLLGLIEDCQTGYEGEYVSNYAWKSVTELGVVSIYKNGDTIDYDGDMEQEY